MQISTGTSMGVFKFLLKKKKTFYLLGLTSKRFRYKKKWATNRKKKTPHQLALEHFDLNYAPVYQDLWPSIRLSLLSQPKHCALVNNFSTADHSVMDLICLGADDIIKFAAETQIDNSIYEEPSLKSSTGDHQRSVNDDKEFEDDSRSNLNTFIRPTSVFTSEKLVTEGEMSQFKVSDIDIQTVQGSGIQLPCYLKVHAYSQGDVSMFPSPKSDKSGLLNYYVLDAASVLPVLALNLQPGDKVLDLCAAPGGKTLVMLQTMLPGEVTCIDRSFSRVKRLKQVMRSYCPTEDIMRVNIQHTNALHDTADFQLPFPKYDKVLVDVPCTTDRHVLHDNDNNIFKPARMRERLDLPQLQADLLCAGIKNCKIGGSIVYATCSLSPAQNDGVIHAALEEIWRKTKINLQIEKLDELSLRFKKVMKFYDKCRYGILVLPSLRANFGPMYVCRLRRVE